MQIRQHAVSAGRGLRSILVFMAVVVVVAPTSAQARAKYLDYKAHAIYQTSTLADGFTGKERQ